MAGLSKAGKLYREFLETLAKERPFYRTKDLRKEAEPVKKSMRALKPEAYEKMTHFEARPTLDAQGKMGETAGPWVSLNPARSRNYGIDEETFLHEMGHHLAYADPSHPLSKYLSNARAFRNLPAQEQLRTKMDIERDAWDFAKKAQKRMKGGEKDPNYKMSKWLKMLAAGTAGSALAPDESEAGVVSAVAKGRKVFKNASGISGKKWPRVHPIKVTDKGYEILETDDIFSHSIFKNPPKGWRSDEIAELTTEVTGGDFAAVLKKKGAASEQEIGRSLRQLHRVSMDAYGGPMFRKTAAQWEEAGRWLRDREIIAPSTEGTPFHISPSYYKQLGVAGAVGGILAPDESGAGVVDKAGKAIKRALRYDFGGAEYPWGAETKHATSAHVVDHIPEKEFRSFGYKNPYTRQDIFKPFDLGKKAAGIEVGQVLRYHAKEGGHLAGEKIDQSKLKIASDNIDRHLRKGGTVRIFDHPDVAESVVKNLQNRGYKLEMKGMVNPPDEDLPADWQYRLKKLGIAGALGGGSMGILDLLQPSEAEAMPRGVYQKVTQSALSGEISSAAKVLVGKVLGGKTIKDVRKGRGNWRGILFDDDTMMTVTNTELNDLSRAFGTKKYTGQFQQIEEGATRTEQALKSLDYHYSRVKPFVTKGTVEMYHQRHLERLREMGIGETPGGSLVSYKGKFFTMPTEYARHLQDLGLLKIEKEVK